MTRFDLKLFLPPIGGLTIYIFGDPATIPDRDVPLTVRVHDECNGSDVFGSDICTCRPYLTHAIEECVKTAQGGGAGVVIYYRKEGRALGEVRRGATQGGGGWRAAPASAPPLASAPPPPPAARADRPRGVAASYCC